MKHLLILPAFCLPACAQLDMFSSNLTKTEADSVRELARKKVLDSGVLKGEQEIGVVKTTDPSWRYYFLARPYADYHIDWWVNGNERVSVYGRGNILELEGAAVRRLPKEGR